jgi:hypothetical protein
VSSLRSTRPSATHRPEKAGCHLQAHTEKRRRLAGGDPVDCLVAVGDLDRAGVRPGQLLSAGGDQLHHRVEIEVARRDLGLGLDDRPQAVAACLAHDAHIGRGLLKI